MKELQKADLVDIGRPVITNFFEHISPEQWTQLREGQPDSRTVSSLAEVLLELIGRFSNAILSIAREKDVDEDYIVFIVEEAVPQTFADVLHVREPVTSISTDHLMGLMSQEVIENVQTELFPSHEITTVRVTPPKRLNRMIGHASEMIKNSLRAKSLMQAESVDIPQPLPITSMMELDGDVINVPLQHLHHVLTSAVVELSQPLAENMTDAEYKQLERDFVEETDILADEIFRHLKEAERNQRNSETRKKHLTVAKDKMKTHLAKIFVKVTILRASIQIRTKFSKTSTSNKFIQTETKIVDSLLVIQEETSIDREVSEFSRLRDLCTGNTLTFVAELRELLHSVAEGKIPSGAKDRKSAGRAQVFHNLEVEAKLRSVIGMLRWWFYMHASSHMNKVILALKSPGYQEPVLKPEEPSDVITAQILITVEALVTRVFKEAGVLRHSEIMQDNVIDWVFEKVQAETGGADLKVTPKTQKNLDKNIFKVLCSKWGGAKGVLVGFISQDAAIIDCIVSYLSKL